MEGNTPPPRHAHWIDFPEHTRVNYRERYRPTTGLKREPFVAGIPTMIDHLVRDIAGATNGFRMLFSTQEFPGYQQRLTWVRPQGGGNVYRVEDPPMEGWLCPALFRYYREAPKELYVKAESKE